MLASRRGRRFAATRLLKGLRSANASLRRVAARPGKLTLLIGGSALVTLAYIDGLAASVQAFGGGAGIAEIGAVYMAASAIAAASPTPGASEPSRLRWLPVSPAWASAPAPRYQPSSPTG